jgi:hypothetical protein
LILSTTGANTYGYAVLELTDSQSDLPVASPTAGSYNTTQQVSLNATGSTSIRYATDIMPADCSSGFLYDPETLIDVSTSQTIYARACNGFGNSSTASFVYIIDLDNPSTIIASPSAGIYNATKQITLNAEGSDYIKYSLTEILTHCSSGILYDPEISIEIPESQTIHARACDNVGNSSTASFVYIIDKDVPSAPVASPNSGKYNKTQFIALSTEGNDSIRYSIIETPIDCVSGTVYVSPIEVSTSKTIYVRVCDNAGNFSTSNFTYVISKHTTSGSTILYRENFLAQQQNTLKQNNPIIENKISSSIKLSTNKPIKLNAKSNDVKLIQIYLNTHGYLLASKGVGSIGHETTIFGKLTKQAVIKFQKEHKLIPDGIIGPLTLAEMK